MWYETLNECKKYIDENHKRPSKSDKKPEIKKIGIWIQHQMTNYSKGPRIMKNKEIKKEWEKFTNKYEEYFKSNEEMWYETLNECKKYIDENHRRPSKSDKNPEIKKIGSWIQTQMTNYSKGIKIMKNKEIKKEWEKFMNEYEEYFKSNEEQWYDTLNECKKYIDENHKRPSTIDKNPEIKKIGRWLQNQMTKYPKGTFIMKNEEIKKEWEKFTKEYEEYLKSNEDKWYDTLSECKKYMDENHKRPSTIDKNPEIKKIGQWFQHQTENYSKGTFIMKNKEIRNEWKRFMNN
jgi:rhamnose utilization protein RhaD (predicted bifunctional aldolase and dehydrogenase)